ncbi:MAG: TfoX/Sxy family protein [Alphaproteobacteria bacterium]|jgi:DNA transformation protein and related proteins|nr:TfoX/Sxy family protein [Alphaproteobacteria bacterium]MBT4085362.1 TfoX/Sxy family protein [Alphaproteobacteria bacterium]MBT4544111.1 TfoX/Sxy family protein [Alphaproteobacteria bacterium]MBT6385164.1 TfoX/Sxy family protein [Alphaproteobacteria bacterium]MBT7744672.1 TfoX/Sxy family protein [Alphaproteobacteria bacterium]
MPVSSEFRDFLLEQLEPLGPVSARRMFGGAGLFYGTVMFALLINDVMYLKTDEASQQAYEDAGSEPFSYQRGDKQQALKTLWRVPDEIMDDCEVLLVWARVAVDAALAASRAKSKSSKKKT